MKLIRPSFKIIHQPEGLMGIYKQIELAGRTCYKSEDKITDDSATEFVERMVASGHTAMLEHGTVYLELPKDMNEEAKNRFISKYKKNPYSKVSFKHYCVTTNLRVIIENDWEDDLKYLCEPTKYHFKRITVAFTSDIHFYKDITRHRVMSWAIESTRFCNYMKDKFNSSVTYIIPSWLKIEEYEEFAKDLNLAESLYFKWLEKGWKAQEAAYFLIQGTKGDVVMTGYACDFKHFFDLRADSHAHPTVQELIVPLKKEFIKKKYI